MSGVRATGIGVLAALLAAGSAMAQNGGGTVHGVVSDNSGAVIPSAAVTLGGNGLEKAVVTAGDGSYTFNGIAPGQYTVSAAFPGFAPVEKAVTVEAGATVNAAIQLAVTAERQEVTVQGEAGPSVNVDPESNATALVLKGEDLAALPDDPDDLADALQALAGPGAGPNGGSIYIDGFSGGQLPPKESIREIRVNQNPFSAEFDRLGFGRIEILTKPGTDKYRGMLFLNDSDGLFNSRNPFASNKPDFSSRMFGGNFGGPINRRASFFFDVNRRQVNDNALVNAIYLDPATLLQTPVRQAIVTPNTRTSIGPRLDYQLSTNHTLVVRFEQSWNSRENNGIGGFLLPPPYASAGYNSSGTFQNFTLTETAVLNTRAINETRFQYFRHSSDSSGNLLPQINVASAFTSGGNNLGIDQSRTAHYEMQNFTSLSRGVHTIRFGVRVRRDSEIDISQQGFGGSFYFDGGMAPVLDAANQPIPGQTEQIPGIEQYRRTLLFQGLGYAPDAIRALGGMPSQFTLQAGNPYSSMVRWDVAPYVQDDWRMRPNLTLSLGLRYEVQTLGGGFRDVAPRIGFAWAPGSPHNGRPKTVIRGGFGMFYNRIGLGTFLSAELLNGTNQLNYTVANPNFFPAIPPSASLSPSQNSIYSIDPNLRGGYMMQSALTVERQLPANTTLALSFINTRGLHLAQTVPINAPLPGTWVPGEPGSGVRPYSDAGNLFAYESGGLMKQKMLMANFNTRLSRGVSLQGNYTLNYASDLPGTPSNPYDFMADWGRSSLDRRHRFILMGTVAAPGRLTLSPFLTLQSGAPYDVVTGRDLFGDTLKNVRPAFAAAAGLSPLDPAFYNAAPSLAGPFIPRNYLTGAGLVAINLRVGRTFGFGGPRNPGAMPSGGGWGGPGGGGGDRGGRGGGMPMGGMMGGGRGGMGGGMASGSSEHRYNLTFSVMVANILNHTNPGGFVGNLNSPLFGQPTMVYTGFGGFGGGTTANNRRVELQTRFTF
jgi:hypothetical protein